MKRLVKFENATEFSYLHQGFIIGSTYVEKKTITDLRDIAKILDKLDSVSTPKVESVKENEEEIKSPVYYPSGDPVREYTEGSLSFTDRELELIITYLEAVQWTTKVVREVLELIDRIKAAPETADIVPIKTEKS